MEQLSQQVAKIAAQLRQEGKEPSLALVKARLGATTMNPALLQAYQAWRNGAVVVQTVAELPAQPDIEPGSDIKAGSEIKAELARIEAKLDLIIKKLGI